MKEPEKPAEAEAADGEAAASTDGDKPAADAEKKDGDDKKPAEEKK